MTVLGGGSLFFIDGAVLEGAGVSKVRCLLTSVLKGMIRIYDDIDDVDNSRGGVVRHVCGYDSDDLNFTTEGKYRCSSQIFSRQN